MTDKIKKIIREEVYRVIEEKLTSQREPLNEMAKLNMKEKQLDTKLQKLQTEYSALTTDLESVKSILNANIQKSFVYCQNG